LLDSLLQEIVGMPNDDTGENLHGSLAVSSNPYLEQSSRHALLHHKNNNDAPDGPLSNNTNSGPKELRYANIQTRMETFETWPPGLEQKPYELAEAGFYYTGLSDKVKCFDCGGGLEAWDPEDSVLDEHLKWFPECGFAKLVECKHKTRGRRVEKTTENDGARQSTNAETNKEVKLNAINRSVSSTQKDPRDELSDLKHRRSCKVCYKAEASVILLPCSHLVTCAACVSKLKECPRCGVRITNVLRTFLA